MLLAIDSGNTNIVFAVLDADGRIMGQWRSSSAANRTSDEFAVWLLRLIEMEGISSDAITDAIIATVVPANRHALVRLCEKFFSCTPLVVGEEGVELGVGVRLDNPDEVGADRLVNAVAAIERYEVPLICVDFGTATTFDVIDAKGNYAGGAIAPGINLSLESLHSAAAKLPRVGVKKPRHVIGTSTTSAMQSGIFWGYVAMIEGMVKRIRDEFSQSNPDALMTVIATGGLSTLFAAETDVIETIDKDLTLRGLHLIFQRNRNGSL